MRRDLAVEQHDAALPAFLAMTPSLPAQDAGRVI
jgi:hypothetical protein